MTNPTNLAYIVSGSGIISGTAKGKRFSVGKEHANYSVIIEALRDKDADKVCSLVDISGSVLSMTKGKCEVQNGVVLYNGKQIGNSVTYRIISMMRTGFDFQPMLRFLENLMSNPSETAREELYLFLEANEIPITEDGHFLAYKKVNANFCSIHPSPDGTHLDHSIGKTPSMDRKSVCADRDRTCSQGLHFCSFSYLSSYGSAPNDKVVIVKINPADVVSIPSDYRNAKGRAWRYEVVAEHKEEGEAFDIETPVYVASSTEGFRPSGPKRDSRGRFVTAS
jgi:hypothetical protein